MPSLSRHRFYFRASRARVICLFSMALLLIGLFSSTCPATEKKYWELSPYRIQVSLLTDTSVRPEPELAQRLAVALQERIDATLNPFWSTEFELPKGLRRVRLFGCMTENDTEIDAELTEGPADRYDKRMLLTITARPDGYALGCREYDKTTRRWGPVLQRRVRQSLMLPEASFALLCDVFAPLAQVRTDLEQSDHVRLRFKGSELPRRTDEVLFNRPGEVYQPLLLRTNRSGEVLPEGVRDVPWTYLTLTEPLPDGSWKSAVHSGTRRPFSTRRRGRVQQLALAVRTPPAESEVRFYAKHDASQGLAGYEVFRREAADQSSALLGLTNSSGIVVVPPGPQRVTTLLLRSDGQLLAKLPVVPGAAKIVEIPIADDTARLRAQAELTALREQLIDVVARRNILMARIRDRLTDEQYDAAQQLLKELDALPGPTRFHRLIASAEQNHSNRSADAQVQARIEKLFGSTRQLLGRFLNARDASQLQADLNAARRGQQ